MSDLRFVLMCILLVGTVAGCDLFKKSYAIGDTGPAGGKVFYDQGSVINGWRYMEAAPYDQSGGIPWYNGSYITTGVTATAVGTGNANTTSIVSSQGVGSYAAQLCFDLVLNGYNDWFLPSGDELVKIQDNLVFYGRGGFTATLYWGSSEYSNSKAWAFYFTSGSTGYDKSSLYRVRAVRQFAP